MRYTSRVVDIQTRDLIKKGLRHRYFLQVPHYPYIQTRDLINKGLRQDCDSGDVIDIVIDHIQTRDLIKKGLRPR